MRKKGASRGLMLEAPADERRRESGCAGEPGWGAQAFTRSGIRVIGGTDPGVVQTSEQTVRERLPRFERGV